jgi:hypothetical protein
MQAGPFFSVVQALLARRMGGWDRLEERLEEIVSHAQAEQKARQRGSRKKLPSKARVLSIADAQKMQADAETYDREITRGT